MRRSSTALTGWLAATTLFGATGCQTAGLRLLSFVGLEKTPLVIGLTLDSRPNTAADAINPFPPYVALQKALADDLGRPVSVEVCFPFQVKSGLDTGWYHAAVVSVPQYARLTKEEPVSVLAIPADPRGRTVWGAVLVVPASSKIQSVGDLRGKVVAFGPPDDARTHHAAVQLLRAAGLEIKDLSLEALPLPGSLKHMPDMRAVAQTVINSSSDAGFIDEAAWAEFPEHDSQEGEPAQDKLRIIGRTVALPSRILIASPKLDTDTTQKLRAFLLAVSHDHPELLEPLGVAGYQTPSEDVLADCRNLAVAEPSVQPVQSKP